MKGDEVFGVPKYIEHFGCHNEMQQKKKNNFWQDIELKAILFKVGGIKQT